LGASCCARRCHSTRGLPSLLNKSGALGQFLPTCAKTLR
jgi:hypothetical protein